MNLDKLISWNFPPLEHAYSAKDTILYALGVGLGADPLDPKELPVVGAEQAQKLRELSEPGKQR